ncbi:MAG: SRPBCC domain-containing protein [Candidatus Nanopelagicales bacterium]
MPRFETGIDIASCRAVVWRLITDAENYPEWNSTVLRVEGVIEPEAGIRVVTTADPTHGHGVKVVEFEPENRMVWRGGLPLGLFTGSRTFLLGDSEKGVRFEMAEDYSGPLAFAIGRTLPDLQPMFDAFAADLRAAAEAS